MGPFSLSLATSDPPPVANDGCAGAIALTFDPTTNSATARGDTTYAAPDYSGTCADSRNSSDVVYAFTTTAPQAVTATVTRDPASSWQPVVYIRRTCASASAGEELACANHLAGVAMLSVASAPAGTWYLIVDGASGTGGAFTLDVALGPETFALANDTGLSSEVINLAGGGMNASVMGTTSGGRDSMVGSCATLSSSPDVVYSLTLAQDEQLTATVSPTALSTDFRPVLVVRSDCGSMSPIDELACAATNFSGASVTASIKRARAGTYYLWVDGNGPATTFGNFTLDIALATPTVPANDSCFATPQALVAGVAVPATLDTASNTTGDYLPQSCTQVSVLGPDLVYSYTPAAAGNFTVSVQSTAFDAVLWVSKGTCGPATNCFAAADAAGLGGTERITINGEAGVAYYIFVDSKNDTDTGPFTVKVQ